MTLLLATLFGHLYSFPLYTFFSLIASAEPVLCPQKFLSSDIFFFIYLFILNETSGMFLSV